MSNPLSGEVEMTLRLDLAPDMRRQLLALVPTPHGAPFADVTFRHVTILFGNGEASKTDGMVLDVFIEGDDATQIEFTVSPPPERPAGLRGDTA